jgi:hypothetical protein
MQVDLLHHDLRECHLYAKKLRRFSVKLDQINDIAGCRAILDDISGVNNLISNIRESFPHKIRQEYSYIDSPKLDGYRSHHFVFEFRGNNDGAIYNGKRVELQIRTRLQHSWATAVEAVGLYRGEDMKGGKGNSDWLRLFALMSAELAYAENCPTHPDVKNRNGRLTEIIQLNNKLRAVGTLEDIKNVTHFSEHYIHERPRYYLIRYSADHTVTVESYSNAIEGAANIDKSEVMIETGDDDSKVVLVEVDKVDKLVEAYPNYFGDVSLFIRNLKSICEGKNAIEYSMAPQKLVAPKPYEKPDYSWLIRQFNKLVR